MQVSEIVKHIKYGDLSNLGVSKNLDSTDPAKVAKAEEQIISYINLGLIELYKRFNISIQAEIVQTDPLVSTYTLRNKNIAKILIVIISLFPLMALASLGIEDFYKPEFSFNFLETAKNAGVVTGITLAVAAAVSIIFPPELL